MADDKHVEFETQVEDTAPVKAVAKAEQVEQKIINPPSGIVVLGVLIPRVMTDIIDLGINNPAGSDMVLIYQLGGRMVLYSVLAMAAGALSGVCAAIASSGFVHNLRLDMYEKIQDYSFKNMNTVENLKWEKRQSSVILTWDTSGGDSDFFRVLRRKHTTEDNAVWTDTIATNLTLLLGGH